jgi:hypothetical protein
VTRPRTFRRPRRKPIGDGGGGLVVRAALFGYFAPQDELYSTAHNIELNDSTCSSQILSPRLFMSKLHPFTFASALILQNGKPLNKVIDLEQNTPQTSLVAVEACINTPGTSGAVGRVYQKIPHTLTSSSLLAPRPFHLQPSHSRLSAAQLPLPASRPPWILSPSLELHHQYDYAITCSPISPRA